jgi:hypothetical protein
VRNWPVGAPSGRVAVSAMNRAASAGSCSWVGIIRVRTRPGFTAFTRTPVPSVWAASRVVSPFSALLESE